MTTNETVETKTKEEPKGIVIQIKPITMARWISVGLGFAIHVLTLAKTSVDQSLSENHNDNNDDTVPVYDAVPVVDIDDKEEQQEEEVVEGAKLETEENVNWTEVERAIQEGVESVDWDGIGKSIKKGVESVDWDLVGTRIEEWSKSVDWDKVGKSISDAFEQCDDDGKKKLDK